MTNLMRHISAAAALAITSAIVVPCTAHGGAIPEEGQPPQLDVEQWQLDQVRIAPETDVKVLEAIGPTHSLDDVVAVLKKFNVPYERTQAVMLPDRMPEDLRAKILALPKGEPFVIPEASFISISVLVGRKLPPGAVRFQPRPAPFIRPQEA